MTCGIYRITSLKSNRHYVGSSQDIQRRWATHKCMLNKNAHHSQALQRAWAKYGKDNFEFVIVEVCNIEALHNQEAYWMEKLNAIGGSGYNCCPNPGSQRGYKRSEESKEKMRKSAIRVAADPEERERRSERAKAQHAAGNLGAKTWKGGPRPKQSKVKNLLNGLRSVL